MKRFLIISLLLISASSWAEGVRWQDLPPASQEALMNLKDNWDKLPADKQSAIAKRIDHWQSLSEDRKSVV